MDIRGQGKLFAISGALFIVVGGIAALFAATEHPIGWALAAATFVGWIYVELVAYRSILSVHLLGESGKGENTAI